MPVSVNAIAYGAVGVLGAVLFAIGTPGQQPRNGTPAAPPVAARPTAAPPLTTAQAAPAPSVAAGNGFVVRSVSIEFPHSERTFPGGAAAETITNNCTACHSPGMILNQAALPPAVWQGEVTKMRMTYKAPIGAEDVPAIVAYLASVQVAK